MLATGGGKPFTSTDWIYEVKYDGYRCMARAGGHQTCELRTKSGANSTAWFPEVAELLKQLPGGPHVIDGEVCVLDDIGRSNFEALQARARRRRWYPGCAAVTLCAFDLLFLGGTNVMERPLAQRKAMLQRLLGPLQGRLVIVRELPARAELFDAAVLGAKLEGFVAKRLASAYAPGVRSPDWLKIKRPGWQEARTWRK